MARLFVYGSLKRGFRHSELVADARFLGAVQTTPGLSLFRVGAYPALVRERAGAEAGRVHGELIELPLGRFVDLDAFEQCPDVYRREWVSLVGVRPAFAYFMDRNAVLGCERIADGQWREA